MAQDELKHLHVLKASKILDFYHIRSAMNGCIIACPVSRSVYCVEACFALCAHTQQRLFCVSRVRKMFIALKADGVYGSSIIPYLHEIEEILV